MCTFMFTPPNFSMNKKYILLFTPLHKHFLKTIVKTFGYLKWGSYIYNVKIKVMRYIVRAAKGNVIKNIYFSDSYFDAAAVESTAKEIYDEVWICDIIMEMMVG